MQNKFDADTIIPTLLTPPYNLLENHLTRTYFSGYFRKYDIQFSFCSPGDSLLVQPENILEPCFPFFENMIEKSGIKVPGSNFYFMNNLNGKISYLGKIHYPARNTQKGTSIFIEINAKTISEGIGFPELLMDRSLVKPFRYKYLSYAKYFDDELVTFSGEYNYNYYLKAYNLKNTNTEFQILNWDGYDHLIYNLDEKKPDYRKQSFAFVSRLPHFISVYICFLFWVYPDNYPNTKFECKKTCYFKRSSVPHSRINHLGGAYLAPFCSNRHHLLQHSGVS